MKKLFKSYWFWCILVCICPFFVCNLSLPVWLRLIVFGLQLVFIIIEIFVVMKFNLKL